MVKTRRERVLDMLAERDSLDERLCELKSELRGLCGSDDPLDILEEDDELDDIFDEDEEQEGASGHYQMPYQNSCTTLELGRRGEAAAARYLQYLGYRIIERNWRCPYGEADIIADDDDTLVFVEVKTRRGVDAGLPEEAVTPEKRRRYEKIAACYLTDHHEHDCRVRFDVMGLLVLDEDEVNGHALIRHHVNAFGVS